MGVPVSRAALRYYGGKHMLASWIASHFPPHTCYAEPFGGAASVLLHKAPAPIEVYNDADKLVVTFFRVLRERPDELRRAIALTPYAREECRLACTPEAHDPESGLDEVERARRFYVQAWQSRHGAPSRGQMGWRFERQVGRTRTVVDAWCQDEHLLEIVARLKLVQLECGDAFGVLARYDAPTTLFYVDPPYVQSLRGTRWRTAGYAVELDDAGHARLAEALRRAAGMVVLSGYDCPLYRELYPQREGWMREERRSVMQSAAVATESLWLSPRTVETLGRRQLSFPLEEAAG